MNSLLHRDGDDDLDEYSERPDREITLGTTAILAIFFALALLCAVFFGFGYSVGHRALPPAAATQAPAPGSSFAGFKPSAGNPLAATAKPSGATVAVPVAPPTPDSDTPSPAPRPIPTIAPGQAGSSAEPTLIAPAPAPRSAAAAQPAPSAVVSATGPIVQIAAVSHQEDADLLVNALKRDGYTVFIRSEPQDKLLHVQVGPFASRKDAEAMRQRLLNDGFNAIVKDPATH